MTARIEAIDGYGFQGCEGAVGRSDGWKREEESRPSGYRMENGGARARDRRALSSHGGVEAEKKENRFSSVEPGFFLGLNERRENDLILPSFPSATWRFLSV